MSAGDIDIESVRGAFLQLVRIATLIRLRQGDANEFEERVSQFSIRLMKVLGTDASVVVDVTSEAMWCNGSELIGGDLLASHLCRTLYNEGLRAIFIEPTTDISELQQLAWILGRDWSRRAVFEADLSAASWQAKFRGLFLDVQSNLMDIVGADVNPLLVSLHRQLREPTPVGEMGAMLERLRQIRSVGQRRRFYANESVAAVEFPRLFESLCRDLEQFQANEDCSDFLFSRLIFEVLRNEQTPDGVRQTVDSVLEQLQRLLSAGFPDRATALLRGPLLLLEAELFPDWPHQQTLRNRLDRLGYSQTWEAILDGMKKNKDKAQWQGALFTLVQAMDPAALIEIAEHASNLPERTQRQAVADALTLFVDAGSWSYQELLEAAEGPALRVVLLMFARRPQPMLIEQLLAWRVNLDPAIREGVLIALRSQQSRRIKEIMRESLNDPATEVRMEALRYVSVYRDRDAAEIVFNRMAQVGPKDCGSSELEAMSRALVLIYKQEAPGLLKELALLERNLHPGLMTALLNALHSAGPEGQRVIGEIGLAKPVLRPQIRKLLGGSGG